MHNFLGQGRSYLHTMFIKRLSRESLIIGAPAKINLFLKVLRRRSDGFHDISSVFQAVSLFDRLRFERVDGPGVTITLEAQVDIPTDERNLISRAFHLMQRRYDLSDGLAVHLDKSIPVAAGLAGGSSDAAATIMAVDILWGPGRSGEELARLGAEIGSDVPFFFTRGQAMVSGRGERVEEIELPTDYWLVLVTPDFGISTAASYAGLKLNLTNSKNPISLCRCRTAQMLVESLRSTGNDFREAHYATYPILRRIEDELLQSGAVLARMTGSGPTVFGMFLEAPDIEHGNLFNRGDWQINTVRPITLPKNRDLEAGGNRGDH